jgi:hypothetical protein
MSLVAFFRLDLDSGVGSPARPVATDQSLGHEAFQAFPTDRLEKCLARADDPFRKHERWIGAGSDQHLQPLPSASTHRSGFSQIECTR